MRTSSGLDGGARDEAVPTAGRIGAAAPPTIAGADVARRLLLWTTDHSNYLPRPRTLGLLALLVAGLTACESDTPDPTAPGGPEGPDPSAVALEANRLDSGGTGVLVSDGFARLELEPAVDEAGTVVPDRWTNLRVTVGGQETDVRRLDDRRMEFSVPTLPAGTYGVDVASPIAFGSHSARVFGVSASEQVVPCFILPTTTPLVPAGDALVFDADCEVSEGQPPLHFQHHGVGVTWPAVPGRGFGWLPEGEVGERDPWAFTGPSRRPDHFVARRSGSSTPTEFWVWNAGTDPRPLEPLNCFGSAEVSRERAAPAEVSGGTCLVIAPESGVILRDGEPVAEWPRFEFGHFVMSDDGWVSARNTRRLFIFDSTGELVVNEDVGSYIRDVRFAPGGGSLYVATEDAGESTIFEVDRATGNIQRTTTMTGIVTAIAASEGGPWIARTTRPVPGGDDELIVERLDPEALEVRRSIAVAPDLAGDLGNLWPRHGSVPVLRVDATGTRLTYTGVPEDFAGVWSHVVEVD